MKIAEHLLTAHGKTNKTIKIPLGLLNPCQTMQEHSLHVSSGRPGVCSLSSSPPSPCLRAIIHLFSTAVEFPVFLCKPQWGDHR